jgi:hypothetical protein
MRCWRVFWSLIRESTQREDGNGDCDQREGQYMFVDDRKEGVQRMFTRSRRSRLRSLGVALLLGLVFAVVVGACGGGAEKATVIGMFEVNGTPQAEWDVFLDKEGVEAYGGTMTDASGHFEISGLDEGDYTLSSVLAEENPTLTCTAPGFRVTPPNVDNPKFAVASDFTVNAGDDEIVKDIAVTCK